MIEWLVETFSRWLNIRKVVIDRIDVLPRPGGVDLVVRARTVPKGGALTYRGTVDAGRLTQDPADPPRFRWAPR